MTALQAKAIYRLSAMMPFVLGATFLAPGEATAGITLKGCVKWWHPGVAAFNASKGWWAFKKGEVEIEWDGAGKDKTKNLGGNGCYSATVRNAYWPYDSHNMNVQAYAKRKFRGRSGPLYVRAFETSLDVYPTYVESSQVKIKDNRTGTRNLWLGNNKEMGGSKPNFKKGNLVQASRKYYWWNIASADIMGRFYDWAYTKGFKQRRSVDIIAPAIGQSAYFNVATNNINMTYSTNPGSTKDGFIRWAFTVLHEGTHALHAHLSPSLSDWAPGIIRPARHNLYTITSPKIAWTEGFAAFLPVAYLTDRGVLGAYANAGYTDADNNSFTSKLSSSSFLEDHMNPKGQLQSNMRGTLWGDTSWFNDPNSEERGGAEGFVAGFLWDLTDSNRNTTNHPQYNSLKNKVAKNSAIRGSNVCQVENTMRRAYRGLPSDNVVAADPMLAYSSDCLSAPLSSIANVLNTRMRDNIKTFGKAYIQGKSEAVKYEVLKAYVTNGMRGAMPSALRRFQNWTITRSQLPLSAAPHYGDSGAPSGNSPAKIRLHGSVKIKIPVRTQNAMNVQFNSARCVLANQSYRGNGCSTNISRGQKSVTVYLKRTEFCSGVNSNRVGESLRSPAFIALDDGVNPIAIPVNICQVGIQGA